MHDLLQQMGWEVLRNKRPGKRIGLKRRQDIVDICTSIEKGTNAIQIINQENYGVEVENCNGDRESLSKMKKLKFLKISNVVFPYGLEHLSSDLRILEWYRCSLKYFPPTFGPKQIYELDMRSSRLEKLWEKDIDLPNLRSINLCGSEDLTKIPDLTSAPKLWKLNLEGCTNLVELHKSLLGHKMLRYVNLKGCRNLRSIGNNMEMDALEALHLSSCSKLEHIPEFGENMKRLEDLYLDGTKIKRLPESLGKMRSLRKLDVSKTDVQELPSFILHLERLRLLHIHGCRHLSLTRTFHSMESSLLGLKELDLSACNLSAIPDGIGLLYSLQELDLSENDFVSLPASISLLSNLRMLCLNSCTRLESLPKLSKINEDTLHGLEIRFSHYISGEGLDVSKFRSSNHGISINPTISCLNCPKLIESQSGSGLADTILKKYLQVRTESRVIPEAIFEIVAAGSEITESFYVGISPSVILKGIGTKDNGLWDAFDIDFDTCIGVGLCAVIDAPDSLDNMRGAYIEVKHEVVAHIHFAGKYWRIPVPVNFLEAELATQLVWYWSVTDDLRGAVVPSQMNQFDISLSVEPEDGNLEVKKFGVRFLCREDIPKLRGPRISVDGIPIIVEMIFLFCGSDLWNKQVCEARMRGYKEVCEGNQELQSLNSSFQVCTCKVITILAGGFKHGSISLDSIREVIESLLEMNQEVVKVILECKEEIRKDGLLFSLVSQFFKMSLRMLELCTDFMKFLKGSGDSWLIVQVAMQQIEAKRRAGTLNYSETMQQLSDLEAAMVPFSADFSTLFQSYTHRRPTQPWDYADQIMRNTKSTSALKVSHVIIAAVLSTFLISAVVALRSALPPTRWRIMVMVKGVRTLFDLWLAGYEYGSLDEGCGSLSETEKVENKKYLVGLRQERWEDFKYKSWENGMRITDFDGIPKLLEELKSRMEGALEFSHLVTKKDEEEMVILMDEIKMRISGFTNIIEDMSKHAYQCISDTRQASADEALQSNYETASSNAKQKGKMTARRLAKNQKRKRDTR